MQPELIADYACITGEGPLWHPDEKRLYWVDIPKGRMFRYDPATGHHEECYQGEQVGGFTLQADGSLLLFGEKGSVRVWKDGQIVRTIIASIPGEEETRFNDVIADPAGRVFCGTMPSKEHLGSLYRLDTDGTLTQLLTGITCSNGMGYTADLKTMYYTDSMKREIYAFDYDKATGAITNQRVLIQTAEGDGIPDGMTVDAQGDIWSARWDGGCLVRFSPEGKELQRVAFPAKKVSCVTFAGDDCTDMYVTTAGGWDKATEGAGAGALFRINLGIKGVPEFRSRVGL
jgi:D-xylonolactonase